MTVPDERLRARQTRLRARMAAAGVQAALITSRSNIAYLTGFEGSAGLGSRNQDGIRGPVERLAEF